MFSGKSIGTLKSSKIIKNDVEIPYTSEFIENHNNNGDNDENKNTTKEKNDHSNNNDKNDNNKNYKSNNNNNNKENVFYLDDYRNVKINQPYTQDYSLCYICQGHIVPGKFNPQKAKALGVIPGKKFGKKIKKKNKKKKKSNISYKCKNNKYMHINNIYLYFIPFIYYYYYYYHYYYLFNRFIITRRMCYNK